MSASSSGERSVVAFQTWQASMTDEAYIQIVFRGRLNRVEVAKGCGIAKAALRQNPEVKRLLAELEDDLRTRSVLPPLTAVADAMADMPKFHQKCTRKALLDARRVSELEAEVIALKAKLKRFEELSSVLISLGDDD